MRRSCSNFLWSSYMGNGSSGNIAICIAVKSKPTEKSNHIASSATDGKTTLDGSSSNTWAFDHFDFFHFIYDCMCCHIHTYPGMCMLKNQVKVCVSVGSTVNRGPKNGSNTRFTLTCVATSPRADRHPSISLEWNRQCQQLTDARFSLVASTTGRCKQLPIRASAC